LCVASDMFVMFRRTAVSGVIQRSIFAAYKKIADDRGVL
jgi:hypothetical protein